MRGTHKHENTRCQDKSLFPGDATRLHLDTAPQRAAPFVIIAPPSAQMESQIAITEANRKDVSLKRVRQKKQQTLLATRALLTILKKRLTS